MQNFVELDLKYAARHCSIPSFYLLCANHAYKTDALKKERTASVYTRISRRYCLPDISRLRTAGYKKCIYMYVYNVLNLHEGVP